MLKGKTALVTGSTSGIGHGISEAFAAAGANVMLNGFGDAAQIEGVRQAMEEKFGVKVGYSGADMSKPAEIRQMVQDTIAQFGALDILVNNAGIQYTAPVDEFPEEKWDAILAINLSAAFHGSTPATTRAGAVSGAFSRRTSAPAAHATSAAISAMRWLVP